MKKALTMVFVIMLALSVCANSVFAQAFKGKVKIGLLTTGTAIATYTTTVTYGAQLAAA
ncbi:MAG: hypothetical protein LLF89_02455 [Spirochaetaceae bacterium]|nr:hypothetical protein [Spirochaetaceae bacterium]